MMKRVGYWISEKKARKLNFSEFVTLCRNVGIELVKLDLDQPLEDQGPFDVIVHKLTDQMSKAYKGNEQARMQCERLSKYTKQHPEIVVLDPIENVNRLLDRHEQYKFVKECDVMEHNYRFFTPPFVEFTTSDVEDNKGLMERHGVQYPFVCKPSVAHGSSFCHKMAIIFNEEGLKDVQPPCVAQTFINHNAVLYKVFIIGEQHFIVERPSIKNFSSGDFRTIFFDSHDVSKADSATFLNELEEGELMSPFIPPDYETLEHLACGVQQKLGLDLFGVDVIIENHTGRYAVIDINAFPSYDGVPDLFHVLLSFLQNKLQRTQGSNLLKQAEDHKVSKILWAETFQPAHQTTDHEATHSLKKDQKNLLNSTCPLAPYISSWSSSATKHTLLDPNSRIQNSFSHDSNYTSKPPFSHF